MVLSSLQRTILEICRISTALCILADAWWWMWSHEVREAYFKDLGLPTKLVYLVAIVYAYFGTRILLNYRTQASCTGMIITYGLLTFVVHHPVGEGGIGEYPRHINRDVNLVNILKYAAVIGGVFQLSGMGDFQDRAGTIMEGTQSYAIVLGRAIIGIHYTLESFWFRLYHHELRTTQIKLMGGDPITHVWIVGAIYFFGGLNLLLGDATRRRIAALLLTIVTSILTVMEGSTVATSLGIYHMTSKARFHHVIVNVQIIIGCVMALTIGGHEVMSYQNKKD
ncbi:uncharacterized protein LOC120345883 [Styela clava]